MIFWSLSVHKKQGSFTPAVLVCVLSDEGDPVADHLQKIQKGLRSEKSKMLPYIIYLKTELSEFNKDN